MSAWKKLGSEAIGDFRIFKLLRERFVSPRTGAEVQAVIADSGDWVNVVALTHDDRIVLIRQFRFGTEQVTLEIPGGIIDPGEAPLFAAQRELLEETGYRWRRPATAPTAGRSSARSSPTRRSCVTASTASWRAAASGSPTRRRIRVRRSASSCGHFARWTGWSRAARFVTRS